MSRIQPEPQQYGPLHQNIPPKRKRRFPVWLIVVLVSVLTIGGCAAFFLAGTPTDDPPVTAEPSDRAPRNDATEPTAKPTPTGKPYKASITKCVRGDLGSFDVVVKITNNTADAREYFFDIGLYDPKDNTVGSGIGSVKVKAGKSATTTTFADLSDPDYKGKVTCEVEVTDF